jgi:hypothetical protein
MKYWSQYPQNERAYQHGMHYGKLGCAPSCNPYPEGTQEERDFDAGWKFGAAFLVRQLNIARQMIEERPSRKAIHLSRLNVKKVPSGIKHLRDVLDAK